jgi:peptidoglycan hydrolase-like protein with peptidoglycan-binding domain
MSFMPAIADPIDANSLALRTRGAEPGGAGPAPEPGDLARGARGPKVAELQRFLGSRGFSLGDAEGHFGPKTEAALKKYQDIYAMEPTGRYDRGTREFVRDADAHWDRAPSLAQIRDGKDWAAGFGTRGDAVTFAQRALNRDAAVNGSASVTEDGKLGDQTRDRVLEFQRARGLPDTGAVDSATLRALQQVPDPARDGDSFERVPSGPRRV